MIFRCKAVATGWRPKKILENLLVVSDDIALPFGTLRLRRSAGGHNGLKNIAELFRNGEFRRMRFGGDFEEGASGRFVLGEWAKVEGDAGLEGLRRDSPFAIGVERTMNSSTEVAPKTE